ncbi:MAG: DUF2142 domain-containing protein [Acidobacteriaceae bacterium]|nr:DUF2142 domain-containing protein [Acidobacteriaceae bacterium]
MSNIGFRTEEAEAVRSPQKLGALTSHLALTEVLRVREFAVTRAQVFAALLFVAIVLPTSLLLALTVPPGQIADEPSHILRAAGLLRGQILGKREILHDDQGRAFLSAGVIANPGLIAVASANVKMSRSELERLKSIRWGKAGVFFNCPNTAVYMPAFYFPSALAIATAKSLDLTPHMAILMARVSNVLCYVAIGALALLFAKRGKAVLFATLTIPMSVSLAGSCNQDCLLIAAAALASALLTRSAAPSGVGYWIAGALLGTVIAVKPPYIALAALMFVPIIATARFSRHRRDVRSSIGGVLLATLPAIIWTAISMRSVAVPLHVYEPYQPGPLWPGNPSTIFHSLDPSAQLQVYLHNPVRLFVLPLVSLGFWDRSFGNWQQMIANLGWLNVPLPEGTYVSWTAALACAFVHDIFFERPLSETGRLLNDHLSQIRPMLGMFAVLGGVWGILTMEYLTWTHVGSELIEGLQGRYLLPLLAAWASALPSIQCKASRRLKAMFALPVYAMAFYGMISLPILIVSTYYLS